MDGIRGSAQILPVSLPASRLITCLLALLFGSLPSAAPAQSIHPSWQGTWALERSNLSGSPGTVRVERGTDGQWLLVTDDERCPLRYDGTVRPAEIRERITALRSMQLDPQYWPAGTQTHQLVGLIREFDQAQQILDSLPADNYRRVRADCPSVPATKADRFFVLHDSRRMFEFGFPVGALGLWIELYRRQR